MSSFLTAVRVTAVLVSALVIQSSLLAEIRFAGVSIDLMLALTIAAGVTGGPDRGAVVGFIAGLGTDLLIQTPFGLTALSFASTGYVVGLLNEAVVRSARWLLVAIAMAGAVFALAVFVLAGELVGEDLLATPDLWRIVLIVSVGCGVLVLPCRYLMRWAWDAGPRTRPAVT
jgi:rod shape-determining protein MreD